MTQSGVGAQPSELLRCVRVTVGMVRWWASGRPTVSPLPWPQLKSAFFCGCESSFLSVHGPHHMAPVWHRLAPITYKPALQLLGSRLATHILIQKSLLHLMCSMLPALPPMLPGTLLHLRLIPKGHFQVAFASPEVSLQQLQAFSKGGRTSLSDRKWCPVWQRTPVISAA